MSLPNPIEGLLVTNHITSTIAVSDGYIDEDQEFYEIRVGNYAILVATEPHYDCLARYLVKSITGYLTVLSQGPTIVNAINDMMEIIDRYQS